MGTTLQDLRGPLYPSTRAGQHAFRGHPEFGSEQDSLWRWRQEDQRCGCGKHPEWCVRNQVPHQPGPPHPYRPRSLLPAGPLQRLGLRTDPSPSRPSGKRL